jgi:predicted RNA binding protein YcfA (HicA-like mRNA interferase family)
MPSEERFAVVKKTLESHGWSLVRISGSHHVFKKPGAADVSIPVHHGKVKPFYVRQVKKLTEGGG